MRKSQKTSPIPVRLAREDAAFISKASFDTGLPQSDLLRRAVRLLRQQARLFKGYSFILDLA